MLLERPSKQNPDQSSSPPFVNPYTFTGDGLSITFIKVKFTAKSERQISRNYLLDIYWLGKIRAWRAGNFSSRQQ
jgi:hypothetical protein